MPDGEVVFNITATVGGAASGGGTRTGGPGRATDDRRAATAFRQFQARIDREEVADELARQRAMTEGHAAEIKKITGIVNQHSELLGRAGQLLSNPAGAVGANVLRMLSGLGPQGAAAAAAIVAIVAAPEVIKQMIRQLAVKGGPLNRDWRRTVEAEVNGALTLRQQKDRQWGVDQFIVAQETDFSTIDGSGIYNSLYLRGEVRQNKMDQDTQTAGLF